MHPLLFEVPDLLARTKVLELNAGESTTILTKDGYTYSALKQVSYLTMAALLVDGVPSENLYALVLDRGDGLPTRVIWQSLSAVAVDNVRVFAPTQLPIGAVGRWIVTI